MESKSKPVPLVGRLARELEGLRYDLSRIYDLNTEYVNQIETLQQGIREFIKVSTDKADCDHFKSLLERVSHD